MFGNTPIDVVKSRMQGLDAAKYRNAFHCVKTILQEDGIRGFYKGTVPRLGRVCGSVLLFVIVFNLVRMCQHLALLTLFSLRDVAIVFSLYEMVNK